MPSLMTPYGFRQRMEDRVGELEAALKEIANRADETLADAKSSGRSTLRVISNKAKHHIKT